MSLNTLTLSNEAGAKEVQKKKETKSKFLGPSIVSGQIFLGDKMGGGHNEQYTPLR